MPDDLIARLREASLEKFYIPERDIDWSAPFRDEDGPALPVELLSLYGHPVWGELAPTRRARLARHEIASLFSAAVRFERLLDQDLAKVIEGGSPG